jgi:hypothetical protein
MLGKVNWFKALLANFPLQLNIATIAIFSLLFFFNIVIGHAAVIKGICQFCIIYQSFCIFHTLIK